MDAFFASVEQRDNPELRGKPVAVGSNKPRGVVAAASYEARKFGVYSAMASRTAARLCPELIFVKGRFHAYKAASDEVMKIFREFTDLVQPMSLDEAYLDVTEPKINMKDSATLIAKEIKKRIYERTGLTATAGISINKFLAKVASGMNKPDGLTVIRPEEVEKFTDELPIGKIPGVGKVTEAKMKAAGLHYGRDVKQMGRARAGEMFGRTGWYFYDLLHSVYFSPVIPDRERKSIGMERTYMQDLEDHDLMFSNISEYCEKIAAWLQEKKVYGKTVTLKIKYHDFISQTRSKTLAAHTNSEEEIIRAMEELFKLPSLPHKPVRLLGISVSNLSSEALHSYHPQMSMHFE